MSLFPALPVFTWGNRPSASAVSIGASIRVIDVGLPCGIVMTSDGTNWLAAGQQELARSGVAIPLTGTTSEIVLATCTVPAALMGLNGGLLIYSAWSWTNSANNKTQRIRFGGIAGTPYWSNTATTTVSGADMRRIRNRGAANSQIGGASNTAALVVASGSALVTSAVDTSQDTTLVLTAQLGLGSETITLENYEVWLLP